MKIWRVDFGPIVCLLDSQSDKMQRLQGYLCRTSQSHLLGKNYYHSNGIKLHKVQESAGSAVGNKYPQGDQAAIQGVTGLTKINHV